MGETKRETDKSDEERKVLEAIALKGSELETKVARLQHELIKATTEAKKLLYDNGGIEEVEKEVAGLRTVKEENEKRMKELETKLGALEVKELEEKNERFQAEEVDEEKEKEEKKRKKINGLVPDNGVVVKHIKTGEEIVVSRRVVGVFLLMTMAEFSGQFCGLQDEFFNYGWRLEFRGNNVTALWPGNGKPGLWLNSNSRMGAIYSLIVREEEILIENEEKGQQGEANGGAFIRESIYGVGIYLTVANCSYFSARYCDGDKNGVRYMVLCHVIMGNMELLRGDKAQFFYGGEEYDNGVVDDIESPKNYIVWNINMNTHIFPEFVFRFKLSNLSNTGGNLIAKREVAASSIQGAKRPPPRIIVGQETMLDNAWKHLIEDGAGIMGMYGMGGVGKTTILTQINNKFSNDRCGFDFVIWVVVSKELHIENIQDEIAEKVGLGGEEWNKKDETQKGLHLYNFLRTKRFMLFLDDIWETVELDKIGIPDPTSHKGCRLAFTTRSLNVCTSMGVGKPMEVQCLADDDAFDLFKKKVGELTLESDPQIPDLAKIVAKKCCGLPLALNVIGETMSSKRTIQEWRRAISVLTSYAAEFSGMNDKILPLLKYSYDSLKGDHVKFCLLYCALYPEDAKIPIEDLIDYWICEGIIDRGESVVEAEYMSYEIIGSLVCASLLMKGVDQDGKDFVCMHDVIREMALWIASDLGREKDVFIVRAGVGLREIPRVRDWNIVERMSLMKLRNNKRFHVTGTPECMKLTTLLLQHSNLGSISSEFFKYMPNLAVLDLSNNDSLCELPDLSGLVSLQYLNLSNTSILQLPKGVQKLKKLIYLDLEKTFVIWGSTGISSLHNLKVLKLFGSHFYWNTTSVKELEALEHLEVLTITIDFFSLFNELRLRELESLEHSVSLTYTTPSDYPEQFLTSHRLMSCTQILRISNTINLESSGISLPATMDKLRELYIFRSCNISEIKMGRICSFLSLVKVLIQDCKGLRELTFLMFAPNLKFLYVDDAKDLEDIINKEKACEVEIRIVPFQKLTNLHLEHLPKLENIYWSPLSFPCLKKIDVFECPNLKTIPKVARRVIMDSAYDITNGLKIISIRVKSTSLVVLQFKVQWWVRFLLRQRWCGVLSDDLAVAPVGRWVDLVLSSLVKDAGGFIGVVPWLSRSIGRCSNGGSRRRGGGFR
ncbi:predicted protein [Arabidopsis lyrata subsp. lyrata]|uniref:Predicted protein n=1 Tax=Arabidopsis lyrata subsp. lyrata TaxID=81972 RepID=D7KVC7_ARALL|nr:predicted protein [Arabidopsis lyrata subsp. lyrata]